MSNQLGYQAWILFQTFLAFSYCPNFINLEAIFSLFMFFDNFIFWKVNKIDRNMSNKMLRPGTMQNKFSELKRFLSFFATCTKAFKRSTYIEKKLCTLSPFKIWILGWAYQLQYKFANLTNSTFYFIDEL